MHTYGKIQANSTQSIEQGIYSNGLDERTAFIMFQSLLYFKNNIQIVNYPKYSEQGNTNSYIVADFSEEQYKGRIKATKEGETIAISVIEANGTLFTTCAADSLSDNATTLLNAIHYELLAKETMLLLGDTYVTISPLYDLPEHCIAILQKAAESVDCAVKISYN